MLVGFAALTYSTGLLDQLPAESQTGLDSSHAKPMVEEPALRRAPAPGSRPGAAGGAEPTPAVDHPDRGLERTGRRGLERTGRVSGGRPAVVLGVEPVPAPLAHVPVHVVKPEPIRLLLPHRVRCALAGFLSEPGILT